MGLETVIAPVYPDQLNPNWPLPEDSQRQGDDHFRNIKAALINFYTRVNFSALPNGAVPAYIGGKFWDSGLTFAGGQAFTLQPFLSPMVIQAGGLNPKKSQLIGVPLDDVAVSRPVTPTATGVYELDIQLDESEVNSTPISFTFTQDSDAWVKGIIVRGAAAVGGVRLTLRDGSASGPILYQTASDPDLIAGGGAFIAASGDSTIPFPQKLEMFTGNVIHVTAERYDSLLGVIVGTGISLKGKTLSGQFVPYQRSIRQAVTRVGVAVKSDLPCLSYLADTTEQTLTSTLTTVGNFVYNHTDPAGTRLLDIGVMLQNLPNGVITINLLVNGVLVDTGGGVTAKINNASAGMAYMVPLCLPVSLNAGANTLQVQASSTTGSPVKRVCRVAVCRADTGGIWA